MLLLADMIQEFLFRLPFPFPVALISSNRGKKESCSLRKGGRVSKGKLFHFSRAAAEGKKRWYRTEGKIRQTSSIIDSVHLRVPLCTFNKVWRIPLPRCRSGFPRSGAGSVTGTQRIRNIASSIPSSSLSSASSPFSGVPSSSSLLPTSNNSFEGLLLSSSSSPPPQGVIYDRGEGSFIEKVSSALFFLLLFTEKQQVLPK